LGVLLWHVAGEIGGDGLFHLARVRKLEAFDSLSLEAVDEFADGGPHAGYALFRRVGPAVAVVCAQVGVTALAPAHGGAYTALDLPATASRQLLVPAALALAFTHVDRPNRPAAASV